MQNFLICYEYISRKEGEILGKLRKAKTIIEASNEAHAAELCTKALKEANRQNTILSVEKLSF